MEFCIVVLHAGVVELVDARDLGSRIFDVRVQVSPPVIYHIGHEGIRTPDSVVRSHVLWSTELQARSPQVGFEPTTNRLTADCSTFELLRIF